MNIDALTVLGLFIVVVVILAIWNSQSKIDNTIKSEVRNEPNDWVKREE